MKQEVRLILDLSVEIDAKHTDEQVSAIIERGCRNAFPNNSRTIHALKFAQEGELYSPRQRVRWTHLLKPPANHLPGK